MDIFECPSIAKKCLQPDGVVATSTSTVSMGNANQLSFNPLIGTHLTMFIHFLWAFLEPADDANIFRQACQGVLQTF